MVPVVYALKYTHKASLVPDAVTYSMMMLIYCHMAEIAEYFAGSSQHYYFCQYLYYNCEFSSRTFFQNCKAIPAD